MGIWLIFFLLCFTGIVFMFYCLMRRQDALLKAMRDEHAQFRVVLRALGARLDGRRGDLGEESRESSPASPLSPISVDEALHAYARKERLDMESTRDHGKGSLPDLKI